MGFGNAEKLSQWRKFIDKKLAFLERCESDLQEVGRSLAEMQDKQRVYAEATQLLRDLYEQTQERFHGQIMQIVSYCLREVFGDDAYEFRIEFTQKRNQVEAALVFVRDGEVFDPLLASGGGALAVACFALRLAVIYLTRQMTRSIMILDEPFVQLSAEYRGAMAELLLKLAEEFDFQFILITHTKEFEMGTIHEFGKQVSDGTGKVDRICV